MRTKSVGVKLNASPANRKNGQTGGKFAGGSSMAALAAGLVLGGGLLTATAPAAFGLTGIVATGSGPGALTVTAPAVVTETNGDGIQATNYAPGTDLTIIATDVSGSDDGIDARNNGNGNGILSVTTTGTVTGDNFNGIRARNSNNGLGLYIHVVDVTGHRDGIDAVHFGTGHLSVTTTGTVTGTTRRGISALIDRYLTSNLTETSSIHMSVNDVTGGEIGIYARNEGRGDLTVTSTGLINGDTGQGIYAYNYNSAAGLLAVTVASVTGGTHGIKVINNGLRGTTVTAGAITGKGGAGVSATNFGTYLTIDTASVSGYTDGIIAQNYAIGNLSIESGDVTGESGQGIYARNEGTDLTISAASVSGKSTGIKANNLYSGVLRVTTTGTVAGENGYGIAVVNSGTDLVVSAASVSGGSTGIYARNNGSGSLSVTATGRVTGTTGRGIYARNEGTDLTISAASVSGETDGIYARNNGSGTLSVTASGAVTGTSRYGIYAHNTSNGAGLTVSTASVSGRLNGIVATNYGSGALSIRSTGSVTGGNHGIVADNYSGTDLTISATSVSGGFGIYARNRGTGDLSVTATGPVAGTTMGGIFTMNDSTGENLDITVGDVTGATYGIDANNRGTGALSVTATGTVTGTSGDGVFAANNGTDLTISTASVSGSRHGIYADNNGTGTLSVTTSGAIRGGTDAAIQTSSNAGGAVAITLLSTSSVRSTSGAAIVDGDGNAVVTINAGAVVNGSISLGAGNDTLNIMAGASLAGVTTLSGGSGAFVDTLNLNAGWGGAISDWEIINVNASGGNFTVSGAISGTGPLTKTGAGAVMLTGANSFTGGTTISSGTLIGNTQSFGTSAIVNNASLVIDQATDASFGSLISGTGSLTKTGAGAVKLTAINSFTGGTTISAGSLIGNRQNFGTGAIVNNASLVIDEATDTSFGLVISGTGSLTKIGAGAVTLTGANSFTGGTTISAGSLIGSSRSFGTGAIVNNASLVIDEATDTSFAKLISGTGSLTKTGAGALTLTGANSFSGGTTIASGTLIGDAQSFGTGAIVNNASLVFDQATNASFAGAISGTGSLTKSGSGTLTLTGVNSFTGTTTVTAGRLNLAGSLAISALALQSGSSLGASGTVGSLTRSAMTLQSGSSLGGNGTVGSLTAHSGSTVSPGNSIGTLTVNGNLTLAAGSMLAIEVAPSGADMVMATGTANLAGNLTITPSTGQYSFFQRFTLVSANTVTGTFANSSLGDFGAKYRPKLMYDATSVVLRLDPNSLVDVSGGTLRGNALAFATAFDTAVFAGYNPDQFVNLYTQGTNLAGALGQFTGERYSAERQATMQSTHVVRDAAFAALNDDIVHAADTASESKYDGDTLTTVWMRAAGSWGTVKADGTGSRYKTDQTAVLTGIDVSTGGFKLGGMVSQSSTDVNLYSFGQSSIESVGATVYAGYRRDTSGFALGFGAGFASNNALGSRAITVPTLAQVLIGKAKSTSLQYFAEASYDFAGSANTRIEPFARIARVELDSKAFTETGGSAALHGDKQSNSRTMTGVGVRGAHASANKTLSASIGWQRTSGDLSAPTNLRLSLIDTPYEVHSAALDRNAVTLDTQASFRLSSHMMFGIGYNAVAGKNSRSHGARATIRYAF